MKVQRVVLAGARYRNIPSPASGVFRAATFGSVRQNVDGAGLLRTIIDLELRREY
jgi:hypothetical protein